MSVPLVVSESDGVSDNSILKIKFLESLFS